MLTTFIFVTNLLLARPLLDSLLFSLAIAVGITPQLLPAVVSTSLATGSRRLAQRKVLVKRLVCIEDLGDLDVLVTDKTGALTAGRITLRAALDPAGHQSSDVLTLGLLATEAGQVGGNPMDAALWEAADPPPGYTRLGWVPFDHERRMTSTLVQAPDGDRLIVIKGAPESVLTRCRSVPPATELTLQAQFTAGGRVAAVASRPAADATAIAASDEHDLVRPGSWSFSTSPKPTPPTRCAGWPNSPSRSSWPPATTRWLPRRSARTWACVPVARSPAPTSMPWTTARLLLRPSPPRSSRGSHQSKRPG